MEANSVYCFLGSEQKWMRTSTVQAKTNTGPVEIKMHTCPKCGYEQPAIWRNTLRRLYTEHCHINDLEQWEPELAAALKKKRYVYLNGTKYRLNKNGNHVHRIEAKLCAYPEPTNERITEPNTEKSKARVLGIQHNGQKQLWTRQ